MHLACRNEKQKHLFSERQLIRFLFKLLFRPANVIRSTSFRDITPQEEPPPSSLGRVNRTSFEMSIGTTRSHGWKDLEEVQFVISMYSTLAHS